MGVWAFALAVYALIVDSPEAAILSGALIIGRSLREPSGFWRRRLDAARVARARRDDVR